MQLWEFISFKGIQVEFLLIKGDGGASAPHYFYV